MSPSLRQVLDKKSTKKASSNTPPAENNTNFTPKPIGVVDVPPPLSKTPIKDRLERTKAENGRTVIKIERKRPKGVELLKGINFILISTAAVLSVPIIVKFVKWVAGAVGKIIKH